MKVIKPTDADQEILEGSVTVFLTGSIENGKAVEWQKEVETMFVNKPVTFYNPRRDDWDSSWEQKQSNLEFNKQVNWELNMLDDSDIIFMYFAPGTQSPISLLELGKYADSGKMIVCCPEGFWRKGNVEIICTRQNIPFYTDLHEAVGALITKAAMQNSYRRLHW